MDVMSDSMEESRQGTWRWRMEMGDQKLKKITSQIYTSALILLAYPAIQTCVPSR